MTCYSWEDPAKSLVLMLAHCIWRVEKQLIIFSYIVNFGVCHYFSNQLSWTGFLVGVFAMWWHLLKRLESSIRDKAFWKTTCLALIWFLWQKRNVRIFLKIKQGLQRLFAIQFTSLSAFRPLEPQHLRAFPFMCSSLTGIQCVVWSVWVSKERILGRKLFK